MFRTTCDNPVTTPPASQPTNSKPAHLEMPASKPELHQTRPLQPCALPHHRAPAPHRTPSRQPFHPHPQPLRDRRCSSTAPTRHSRACRPQHQRASAAGPHTNHPPDPDLSKVTTRAAHMSRSPTIPMPADDGDQYRVIVAPDSRMPGPPTIPKWRSR
jgi:hypothetical protein